MSLHTQFLEKFAHWIKNNDFEFPYSERTIDSYQKAISEFLQYLDNIKVIDLNEINIAILRHFIKFNPKTGTKYGHSTINIRIAALDLFFTWSTQQGFCTNNPIEVYKESEKEKRKKGGRGGRKPSRLYPVLFPKEQEKLMDNLMGEKSFNGIRDAAIIATMLAAAPRPEEIIKLPLNYFYFDDNCLRVIGKGNKERLITLDKDVREIIKIALRTWLIVREQKLIKITGKPDHPLLFITNRATPMSTRLLRQQVSYRIRQAGIPEKDQYGAHILRHTGISMMLHRKHKSLKRVQKDAGHKKLETTIKYIHLIPEE